MRDNDEPISPELERAARLLRESPEVRPEWRGALLDRVAHERAGQAPRKASSVARREIHLSLPMAIAAGLLCAIAGGSASLLATRRAPSGPAAAEAIRPAGATSAAASSAPAAATLPVRFSVVAPQAAQVSIVGDFNQWNPTALPMRRSADGRSWEVEVRLPLGHYSYAFLIDGKISPDPAAPRSAGDDFGAPNSVLMVRGS